MLDREVVERLGELFELASPGPWQVRDENEGDCFPPRPLWCIENEFFHDGPDDAPAFQATVHYGAKEDADLIAAMFAVLPDLLRVYRMWMEASVVKVERRTATFGTATNGSQYVIGDDYMGTPAFNDLVGQRVRLVRDGDSGEGES